MPFFYLDAHWGQDLPLPEEVNIIQSFFRSFVIMVDDFRHPTHAYGYDSYGGGVELTMEYLHPRLADPEKLEFLFPTASEANESGPRRGTLVIMPRTLFLANLTHDPHLAPWSRDPS